MKAATFLAALLFCLSTSSFLNAQDTKPAPQPDDSTKTSSIQWGLIITYEFGSINVDSFNNLLGSKGYPTLSGSTRTTGLGLSSIGKNWIGTISAGLLSGGTYSNTSSDMQLLGLSVLADIGYAVIHTDRFRLYPMVGYRLNALSLRIDEKTSLAAILNNPRYNGIDLTCYQFPFTISVGADYRFPSPFFPDTWSNRIGLQLGYTFSGANRWASGAATLSDAPSISPQGVFLRINLTGDFDNHYRKPPTEK